MRILTENQKLLLKGIGASLLKDDFYFTGGTALTEFYLQHRYSDDLDFFTSMPENIIALPIELPKIAKKLNFDLEIKRTSQFFVEAIFEPDNILTHWATDTPVRLEPLIYSEEFGIYYESEFDIGANKISALYDRWAVKDFVDVYFLEKDGFPFEILFDAAQKKHAGIDKYWMKVALTQITKTTALPRMIKKLTLEELQEYSLNLIERILGTE